MALTCEASLPLIGLLLGTSDIAKARLFVNDKTTAATKVSAVTLAKPMADGCLSAAECVTKVSSQGLFDLKKDKLLSCWTRAETVGGEEGNEQAVYDVGWQDVSSVFRMKYSAAMACTASLFVNNLAGNGG